MTTKKYILTYVLFAVMLMLSPISFFYGMYIREKDLFMHRIFIIMSIIFFVLGILIIVINYKKIVAYDTNKIRSEVENIDYIIINNTITKNECFVELVTNGYNRLTNELFEKENTHDADDSGPIHYYSKIIHVDNLVNIEECLKDYTKGTNYNIGYIFVQNNIEENLNILREYIKETIVDVEIHVYKHKVFFAPIIITNDKIYYIKDGSLVNKYRQTVSSGISFINKIIKNR